MRLGFFVLQVSVPVDLVCIELKKATGDPLAPKGIVDEKASFQPPSERCCLATGKALT